MGWLSLTVDKRDEALVAELVSMMDQDELSKRAVQEAFMAKLTAALAAGRATNATIIGLINAVLLVAVLIFK